MGLFEEYETYLNRYQQQYGPKTIVFYQNGMFFEMYGVDNEQEKIGLVREMSGILNLQMTRRNKTILVNNRSNCLMAGFPLNQLDRYVTLLTEEEGYVVVVVEQITPAPNPTRAVTNVIGPGTNLKYITQPNNNYLLVIYLESESNQLQLHQQLRHVKLLTIGLSAIDVSTGQCLVYQVNNTIEDANYALDQTFRMIQTLQPKELILTSLNCPTESFDLRISNELINYWELVGGNRLLHRQFNSVPIEYTKISYQNEFLKKVYPQTGMLQPIEYLDLERWTIGLIAFMILIDFCYHQNEQIIQQINRPIIWNNQHHLNLDNNCITQLNLVANDDNKHNHLMDLLDQTSTAMGHRLFKEHLLTPLIDPIAIQQRYEYLEYFRQSTEMSLSRHLPGHQQFYLFQKFEPYLKQIGDLERYHRKMAIGLLQPCEFCQLHTSYQQIIEMLYLIVNGTSTSCPNMLSPIGVTTSPDDSPLKYTEMIEKLSKYIESYQQIFDIKELSKYNLTNVSSSFFKFGYESTIDQLQDSINQDIDYFDRLAKTMSQSISTNSDTLVNYEQQEELGYHLVTTVARYQTFLSYVSETLQLKLSSETCVLQIADFEVIKNRTGKTCKITSIDLRRRSHKIIETREQLIHQVIETYKKVITYLYQTNHELLSSITHLVALIDVYKSNAKVSVLYHYSRPTIISSERSELHATQLRHPIIERLQETVAYVPQDIELDDKQQGILLYGVNCAGKCYHPETPILMYNGDIKYCYQIVPGDQLMGDDSTPRNVLSIVQGIGQMYDIIPSSGDIITVNGPHILCLKADNNTIIHEISVDDYLTKTDSIWRSHHHLYNIGVDFPEQKTDIDPYLIGYLIGHQLTYNFIPTQYLINNQINRLKLLKGLIASNGLPFICRSQKLAFDVCYLARSLGYLSNLFYRFNWSVEISNFDGLRSFVIKPRNVAPYCGFIIDGNQRHLLGDFTVVHNSSVMKAVGLSIIMAQAGLYVPASQYQFSPYHHLLTRILGNDNLFKGLSSFAVEMCELRGILRRADRHSLVLGDEICHGTETISAVALVASAVITLTERGSNFLFATHLHQLSQLTQVTQLPNVAMYHLSVRFDQTTGQITYERQLKKGSGYPIYGLEVAKAMDLPVNFLDLANQIRKQLMGLDHELVSRKSSNYNTNLYLSQCAIPNCRNPATMTHHIKFQMTSDSSGFIQHIQKNHKSNLLPICNQCHQKIHNTQPGETCYIINGYQMTSNGPQLDYQIVTIPISPKKKLKLKEFDPEKT